MIPVWPLTEDFCQYQLMIYSPGTWKKVEELKGNYDKYSDAFAEFVDSGNCPQALTKIINEARKNAEIKLINNHPARQFNNQYYSLVNQLNMIVKTLKLYHKCHS